jgi:uncharacterized membrane protein YgcG
LYGKELIQRKIYLFKEVHRLMRLIEQHNDWQLPAVVKRGNPFQQVDVHWHRNGHRTFTLRGLLAQLQCISQPMMLGNSEQNEDCIQYIPPDDDEGDGRVRDPNGRRDDDKTQWGEGDRGGGGGGGRGGGGGGGGGHFDQGKGKHGAAGARDRIGYDEKANRAQDQGPKAGNLDKKEDSSGTSWKRTTFDRTDGNGNKNGWKGVGRK